MSQKKHKCELKHILDTGSHNLTQDRHISIELTLHKIDKRNKFCTDKICERKIVFFFEMTTTRAQKRMRDFLISEERADFDTENEENDESLPVDENPGITFFDEAFHR